MNYRTQCAAVKIQFSAITVPLHHPSRLSAESRISINALQGNCPLYAKFPFTINEAISGGAGVGGTIGLEMPQVCWLLVVDGKVDCTVVGVFVVAGVLTEVVVVVVEEAVVAKTVVLIVV